MNMEDSEVLKLITKEVKSWDKMRDPKKDRDCLAKICEILRDEGIL
jgi:hypothetical protein